MKKMRYILTGLVLSLVLVLVAFSANDVPTVVGDASIRISENPGMRIKAVVDLETANDENTIEYGFIVTRKIMLDAEGLTIDEFTLDCNVSYIKGISRRTANGTYIDKFYEIDEDKLYFTGQLLGISRAYYDEYMIARPYLISNGRIRYGSLVEESLYESAKKVKSDEFTYEALPENKKEQLDDIIYSVEGCEVTFMVTEAEWDKQKVDYNETPNAPEVPQAPEGYVFSGWAYRQNGAIVALESQHITKNTVFYAVFKPAIYDVTFYVDGAVYAQMQIKHGETVTSVPANPAKTGYNFNGWTIDGEAVDFSTYAVTGDTNVVADFEIKEYDAIFHDEKGTELSRVSVKHGYSISNVPAAPTKTGYTFLGWSAAKNSTVLADVSAPVTGTCHFYAVYEINTYDVVFYADGVVVDSQKVNYASKPTAPTEPVKSGYNFLGWTLTEDGTVVVDVTKTSVVDNINFYAVYEKITIYNINFYTEYGVLLGAISQLDGYVIKASDVPAAPTKVDYEFIGWTKDSAGEAYTDTYFVGKAVEQVGQGDFYATYTRIPYIVVFHDVGGSVLKQLDITQSGTINDSDIPEITGYNTYEYEFLGWSTASGATSAVDVKQVIAGANSGTINFYPVLKAKFDTPNPNKSELIQMLERGGEQLKAIRMTNRNHRTTRDVIVSCLNNVLVDAYNHVYITKEYVLETYADTIDTLKTLINETMTPAEKSAFGNVLTNERNIDKEVQDFLINYFDIDINSL